LVCSLTTCLAIFAIHVYFIIESELFFWVHLLVTWFTIWSSI
jgi:hypothetical protein